MSERSYALLNLRRFIKQRALEREMWKPNAQMIGEEIDTNLEAIKIRNDEDLIIIAEIDRVLRFKPSGRKPREEPTDKKG